MRASGREPSADHLDPSQRGILPNTEGPTAFGKYQLFAVLGRGGMAEVFLAVSRGPMGFNKLVVVKRLRAALAEEVSFLNMFLDEARLAARLSHPNVIHTYEVGEQGGRYFIAMEYLEGQSLYSVMRALARADQTLSPAVCARIVADALAGLHYAHELKDYDGSPLNIIHRDVSPHNVFVTYDGQVKLVDFGIAKAALSTTKTEVGVLKGKIAYMAPEQATGSAVDRSADTFAMGIVLWELLTRRRLMTGDSPAVTLHNLLNRPVPRVSEAIPDIDPRLDDIVAQALQKDPAKRFATANDMREKLEAFLAQSGAVVRSEEIGAKVNELFLQTRADVKRQIQEHMAVVERAANTGEHAMLAAQAVRGRLTSSGSLPNLGVTGSSGSGSGVVNLAPGMAQQAVAGSAPPPRKRSALPVVLVLVAVLAAVGSFAAWRWTASQQPPVATPEASSVAPVAADRPAPSTAVPAPRDTAALAVLPSASSQPATPASVATASPQKTPPWSMAHILPPAATPRATATPTAAPPATTEPEATAANAPGSLTLDTVPWTRVSEGGRSLGTTPILGVPMSPGAHTLSLENPGEGIHTSLTVSIKTGERTSRRVVLKQPQ